MTLYYEFSDYEGDSLHECAKCGELICEEDGQECENCGKWLCDSCAGWTLVKVKGYDTINGWFDKTAPKCRECVQAELDNCEETAGTLTYAEAV